MIEIVTAKSKADFEAAAVLFKEYAAWLNIDLCFQNFDEELKHLEEMYSHPTGVILLTKENELFSGCVGVRKKEEGIAELKRMYIQPEHRKAGLGAHLLDIALSIAKELGYKKIRLDTLSNMTPAMKLYKKAGFYEIEPYYFNPQSNAVFFEKDLEEKNESDII